MNNAHFPYALLEASGEQSKHMLPLQADPKRAWVARAIEHNRKKRWKGRCGRRAGKVWRVGEGLEGGKAADVATRGL